jgi:hypothetical protein
MEEKITAIVIDVKKRGEIVDSAIYVVDARIHEPADKYSSGLYWVKILNRPELAAVQSRIGYQMEHGEFTFESIDDVKKGEILGVSVTPVPPPPEKSA